MSRRKRYYLGRVHKLGHLNDEMITQALLHPAIVEIGGCRWTFTKTQVEYKGGEIQYVYSELSKFDPSGEVLVINEERREQDSKPEPNLLIASSPFVYIPEYSGIAYQHIWNVIQRETFTRRFQEIVPRSVGEILVDCDIEPISDLREFERKLSEIDVCIEIKATVRPPNPLFGKAWEGLNQYIKKRSIEELKVQEKSNELRPLNTDIAEYVSTLIRDGKVDRDVPLSLTDAAVLMAADGYGVGKVIGKSNNETIVLETSETQKSFLYEAEPDPKELYRIARLEFESINMERDMKHLK